MVYLFTNVFTFLVTVYELPVATMSRHVSLISCACSLISTFISITSWYCLALLTLQTLAVVKNTRQFQLAAACLDFLDVTFHLIMLKNAVQSFVNS